MQLLIQSDTTEEVFVYKTYIRCKEDDHDEHWQQSCESELYPEKSTISHNGKVDEQYGPHYVQSRQRQDSQGHCSVGTQTFPAEVQTVDIGNKKGKNEEKEEQYGGVDYQD